MGHDWIGQRHGHVAPVHRWLDVVRFVEQRFLGDQRFDRLRFHGLDRHRFHRFHRFYGFDRGFDRRGFDRFDALNRFHRVDGVDLLGLWVEPCVRIGRNLLGEARGHLRLVARGDLSRRRGNLGVSARRGRARGRVDDVKFGIEVVPLGELADPRQIVRLAIAADRSGWDVLAVWDHLGFVWGTASADPWVTLSAVAHATDRLRIGTTITPLARRRPHVLAHTVATLDVLSGGRAFLGAGLGGMVDEFTFFGDSGDPRVRARRLDEALEILDGLWAGQRVVHCGGHFTVEGVTLAPVPLQRPRVPIWIGGDSRPALRRAASWDGWATSGVDRDGTRVTTPEQVHERVAYIDTHRVSSVAPFDVAVTGVSSPAQTSLVREFADAGATVWLESLSDMRGPTDQLLARVGAGPPL